MPKPAAAKQGDMVVGKDTHIIMVPSPGGPVPTPTQLPFSGTITGGCSPNVMIDKMPAAVVGSTANNTVPHLPAGGPFQVPPTNQGIVAQGSTDRADQQQAGRPRRRPGEHLQRPLAGAHQQDPGGQHRHHRLTTWPVRCPNLDAGEPESA